LTAKTRFAAFSGAFEQAELVLNDAARARLPVTAASAAWAKGSAFCRVANQLRQIVTAKDLTTSATAQDLERAFACTKNGSADFALVSFQATDEETPLQETGKSLLESVGGNTQAKLSLEDALALDPRKRRMLARFGLSPPTGILLYGPPGCGKTLLAKAVAKLLKAPRSGQTDSLSLGGTFISLSSSDIIRAEIGTSEKMVVSAFEFADKNAPAVIFLDEFQALFTERSRGGSGKLATTLLQCLDDIKRWRDVDNSTHDEDNSANADSSGASTEGSRVIVLGATNSPWMVDSAFLRSGRFDRVVHVGLPTDTERESILLVHIGRMRVRGRDDSAVLKLLCKNIAGKTAGFSGADLAALCRAAAIRALIDVGDDGEIEERHFIEALYKDLRASSDDNLVQRLLKWGP
jgi:SpoVK/Ycf46/Vps4 family AAA+-type ATPase